MKRTHTNFTLRIFLSLFLSFILFSSAEAQRNISGTVTDFETGEPLIGANILIKGTSSGTVTDFDGNYELSISEDASAIVVSYTGYTEVEIQIGEGSVYDVQLAYGEILSEVVVIGYGTVERRDVTGSVQSVTSESFNKGAITSPQELVSGKIAGVSIITGADPGGGSRIRIRGESSLTAANDPLIVIDGVPLESGGISGSRNPLNVINPNDIETFTVLKDASAAAIYGNRASGGVILITTKKGKVGAKPSINYTGNVSFGNPVNMVDVLDGDQYRQALTDYYGEGHPSLALLGDANTNWQDAIYGTAIGHDHNVSVAGAVKDFPFRVSLGYTDKGGILKGDRFNRYTAGLNVNPSFLDNTLQLNLHFKGFSTRNTFADRGAIGNSLSFDPTQEIYDEGNPYGGFYTWTIANGNPNSLAPTNPLALLELREDKSNVSRYVTNAGIDYRFPFLKSLRANLNLGYDASQGSGTVIVPDFASFAFDEINGGGVNNDYSQDKTNSLLEYYMNFKEDFGIHRIDLMAGYSWQHFYEKNEFKNSDTAGTASETEEGRNERELYLLSLYTRLNYSYGNLATLTFTVRRDGTSRFAPENRWGTFPSTALALNIIENDNRMFNNLKLRLGWGITGQEAIGDYYAYLAQYQLSFDNARYQFGDSFIYTLRPNGYDRNIKWEETTSYNAGIDFSIIKDRLTGTLDYYQRYTKDLLNQIPVPAGTNLTNFVVTNIGNMENKGVELSLNLTPFENANGRWDLSLNGAYNRSKITKLTAVDDPDYIGVLTGGIAGGVGSNIQIHSVGYAPSSFYVFEQLYDADGNILEGQFADRNEDGIVNELDKYRYKKPDGDFIFGMTSNFNWKNLDFSFGGRASINNYIYNNVQTDMGWLNRMYGTTGTLWNIHQSALDNNAEEQANLTFSDYFVRNASFLRFDHFTLGYDLTDIIKKSSRIYVTVQNPVVFTKYDGLDPEIVGGIDNKDVGIDNNVYPRPRTFVFGLSVNF